VLPKIDGPAVLVWYDAKENSMNIARTRDREIRWVFDKSGTCWFASEREMLWAALCRNDIAADAAFWTIPTYHHYKWKLADDDSMGLLTKIKFPEYVPPWKGKQSNFGWDNTGGSNMGKASSLPKNNTYTYVKDTGTNTATTEPTLKRHEKGSKRKIENIDKRLVDYGLKVGDEITVTRTGWLPSKGDLNIGDIHCLWPQKNLKVVLPDVPKALWERQGSGQYIVIVYNVIQEMLPKQGKHQPVLYAKTKNYQIKDLVQGPNGCLIPRAEFLILAKDGCRNCRYPVFPGDHEITEWVNGHPLCNTCSSNFQNDKEFLRK